MARMVSGSSRSLPQQTPYPAHLAHEPGVDEHGALSVVLDEQVRAAQRVADGVQSGRDVLVRRITSAKFTGKCRRRSTATGRHR